VVNSEFARAATWELLLKFPYIPWTWNVGGGWGGWGLVGGGVWWVIGARNYLRKASKIFTLGTIKRRSFNDGAGNPLKTANREDGRYLGLLSGLNN